MTSYRCPTCNDILFRGHIERGVIEILCKKRDCTDRRKLLTFTFPEPAEQHHRPATLHLAIR